MIAKKPSETIFHPADILYALEWVGAVPEELHWRVALDNENETRLVSVFLSEAQQPTFEISRIGGVVKLVALVTDEPGPRTRYFRSLRDAVLAICPLDDDFAPAANEAMKVLYPRPRDRG